MTAASTAPAVRDLALLPKAHLHLHLEAGMRSSTLADLAAQKGLDVPVIGGYGSFAAFADTYDLATVVLQTRADWERLAEEMLADAVAEGVAHLEPAFWAERYRERFGSDREIWTMVLEVFTEAARRHGVSISFISAVDRVLDDEAASVACAELAVELAPLGVTGFGLHNDEVGHPPTDFVTAFAIARDGGLIAVPHAGELDEGRHVLDAIERLGAVRIAHGVRCGEVPGLIERIAADGIVLDICPTSNRLLGVVPDTADHPIRGFLDAGVRCTLNADDPLLFDSSILGDYQVARDVIGLTDEQLAGIARTSIEAASMADAPRAAALAGIDAWLAGPTP
ncbi:adenosine deaminase [Nakamurella leprariae]|uniref:Adenosine deaminase n=1 Tax=Nakamurella leprariae TaxID=2803911 RepID=A0A938YBM9_9ACTN|nr:adenosine deaminase [Nakamurella leprariae]MBM9466626.1 adenosine deaminase [Nakamurella leprariae]